MMQIKLTAAVAKWRDQPAYLRSAVLTSVRKEAKIWHASDARALRAAVSLLKAAQGAR